MYYYKIYDDNEELNFIKSSVDTKTIEEYKREFESKREKYSNSDFLEFLKHNDVEAEIISIHDLSY